MSPALLLTFYGDDFTGSTDAMEALSLNGVPTVLFLQSPQAGDVAQFAHCRALGIAGISRSQTPEWMSHELPGVFSRLQQLGAPLCHYKICSTFDSAPQVGSIGRAIDIGHAVFGGDYVPLLVGAPVLRRYTLFGNLFATLDGATHRIDRHPVMSMHPVTPMHEADLRRHLADQTDKTVALLDILALQSADVDARLDRVLAANPDVLLFDVLDDASLAQAGRLLWERRQRATFVVGSSGVEYALAAHWRHADQVSPPAASPSADAVERVVVVSGSCSPVTEAQIHWACQHGFAGVQLDAARFVSDASSAAVNEACAAGARALHAGQSVVLYTALGRAAGFVEHGGRDSTEFNSQLGTRVGELLRDLCERERVTRVVVAGGDTSGHAARQLDMYALTLDAPLAPGGPLCRAHSRNTRFDGLQIVLKGGQVGSEKFFAQVREGAV
ncbi:MAG: four-carbon acid sugar kinase family protein [Gammaproteobacteria bacterium]|nr:four-carbon acid sugar kinase family protein [Gammaproteobacteria bacterium]